MNAKDLAVGITVYHTVFPHWGEGKILKTRERDLFGYKVVHRYYVYWKGLDTCFAPDSKTISNVWCRASELRKTFNQKKADAMAKLKSGINNSVTLKKKDWISS